MEACFVLGVEGQYFTPETGKKGAGRSEVAEAPGPSVLLPLSRRLPGPSRAGGLWQGSGCCILSAGKGHVVSSDWML